MPSYFNAREILAESWRNRRGRQVPFIAGQWLGLTINEDMPDVCHLPSGIAGAAEVSSHGASAASEQETDHG